MAATRGPAPVAQQMYEETADSIRQREVLSEQRRLAPEPANSLQAGRPTKKDRRDMQEARRLERPLERAISVCMRSMR